jgi:dTMP kinase
MPEKGKFVVVEGGEGSGKTSCIKFLKERSLGLGAPLFTREPGGTEVGEKIREILLNKSNSMTTFTELFLFCASRAEHCAEVIRPALRKGINVICDRFSPSTFAYQIVGAQKEKYYNIFTELDHIATNCLKPDMVIYLDIDPAIGLKRRKNAGEITRFDAKDLAFHQRVREGFLEQAKQSYGHWVIVDASRDENVVQDEVVYIVKNLADILITWGRVK